MKLWNQTDLQRYLRNIQLDSLYFIINANVKEKENAETYKM